MRKYVAHSENDLGKFHVLKDHLDATSGKMIDTPIHSDFKQIFGIAGILHDFGKYQEGFQKYLLKNGPKAPHAALGAAVARKLKMNEVSFAIDGHHKGLPDKIDWQVSTNPYVKQDNACLEELIEVFQKDTGYSLNTIEAKIPVFENHFEREFFIRYLFSTLTDADWLDTENHFNPDLTAQREKRILDYDFLISRLGNELKNKNKDGKINRLRNEARDCALNKAEGDQGFYSLNLPTGLGKTLTSVSWALHHAKHHKLKRIIIVLPYVNIIDQTAAELKRIFGNEAVLEHHSSYNEGNAEIAIADAKKGKEKLATENWDYPIIVTTTVQFFESLFANKPAKCRKVHNIAETVVIFDEVQTLPKELVTPTLTMLQNVQKVMRTTFLFCTATQPAFEKNERLLNGIESITSLVQNTGKLFAETRRVKYEWFHRSEYDTDEIIRLAEEKENSVLAIFNTKKKAMQAYIAASENRPWDKCFHLSTAMCPAHRKTIIAQIRQEIQYETRRVFVASTQLIEAGVDLDFPVVFREYAPLDSIIQAAGRCNREGKMSNPGEVLVFRLADKTMPDTVYSSLSEHTLELLDDDPDKIYDPAFFGQYYLSALKLYVDDDKKKINDERKKFNFKTIAAVYRIISSPTKSLFIWNYNEESGKLYERIKYKPVLSRDDFRETQAYSVQVYDTFLNRNAGMWEEKLPDFRVWFGNYSSDYGITEDISLTETII